MNLEHKINYLVVYFLRTCHQLEFPFINKSITIGIKNSKLRIAPVSITLMYSYSNHEVNLFGN